MDSGLLAQESLNIFCIFLFRCIIFVDGGCVVFVDEGMSVTAQYCIFEFILLYIIFSVRYVSSPCFKQSTYIASQLDMIKIESRMLKVSVSL